MQSHVSKWGNSLGIRIPRVLADQAGITDGATVELCVDNGQLVVQPIKAYTLDALLSKVTSENLHQEVDTGSPIGRETW